MDTCEWRLISRTHSVNVVCNIFSDLNFVDARDELKLQQICLQEILKLHSQQNIIILKNDLNVYYIFEFVRFTYAFARTLNVDHEHCFCSLGSKITRAAVTVVTVLI